MAVKVKELYSHIDLDYLLLKGKNQKINDTSDFYEYAYKFMKSIWHLDVNRLSYKQKKFIMVIEKEMEKKKK